MMMLNYIRQKRTQTPLHKVNTFYVMVRTISHAYEFHDQVGEMAPPLLCPPMRYSDATAHGLQDNQGGHTVLNIMTVEPRESSHFTFEPQTIIVCQHVTPIHTGSTASIARLKEKRILNER